MKPTSVLSLILVLHIATAVPIPSKHTNAMLEHCPHCSSYQNSSPPSKLSTPHFPSHQLFLPCPSPTSVSVAGHRLSEEILLNNAPITPQTTVQPSEALAANVPLVSSYLLSLHAQNSLQPDHEPESEADALPAKPTSALPHLRKEDAKRYWASLRGDKNGLMEETVGNYGHSVSNPKCFYASCHSTVAESSYSRASAVQSIAMPREYNSLLVVGIVGLFLCGVIILEAIEKIADHGIVPFDIKEPFYLQTPSLPKYEIAANNCTDSDVETETRHNSDVFEKV
ncbi:uncharacterized protein PAC_14414 [Phialocephala subalpina]|uniref:Uncharacterized protein n=1 Tax=Phialocephala subalpina TaxID=576137 RepID=A0A1L7XHT2_9HELO|nr:uncharacterized protein PAC_14414 [Phialocephala subalpina]